MRYLNRIWFVILIMIIGVVGIPYIICRKHDEKVVDPSYSLTIKLSDMTNCIGGKRARSKEYLPGVYLIMTAEYGITNKEEMNRKMHIPLFE